MTENRTIEVPVTREEGVVERVPVEGREAGQFESGQKEIRVPVSEEQVRVEKQPVVTEEVKGVAMVVVGSGFRNDVHCS